MTSLFDSLSRPSPGPGSIALVRVAVGLIFATQGISQVHRSQHGCRSVCQDRTSSSIFQGVYRLRSSRSIGMVDKRVRDSALVIISTAITTTKIPELFRATGVSGIGDRRQDGLGYAVPFAFPHRIRWRNLVTRCKT
jgi:hypothetical protein